MLSFWMWANLLGQLPKVLEVLNALEYGNDCSVAVVPIITLPDGSFWLPTLGVQLSSNLQEVRQCRTKPSQS